MAHVSLSEQKKDLKSSLLVHLKNTLIEVFYCVNIDLDGGLCKVEMLYKSNVVAFLGGGKTPKFTPNKVVLWDDSQQKVITEIRLTNEVINVKLKKEK